MNIRQNCVATFHHTVRNERGEEVETSRDGEPTAYLHGADNILPALEDAMEGLGAGDTISITLDSEQAYGQPEPNRERKVPVKHLLFNGRLRPGMIVHLNTSAGRHAVTVLKVGRHSATVDTNHPLAGQTLTFDIEVLEVREASREELSHGHAHGAGGHHH
ncbi:MAG: peptidylprolyl isomerase [Parahaliea sp.]